KRGRVARVLVICPKILIDQWVEELGSKFGIDAYGATGAELPGAAHRTEPVIVTTYQSASGFLESGQASGFDMLILDEAHKVRNLHGSPTPPRMAKAIFEALRARAFKYVLMLTATPIQNRLWDIYSLVDCLAVARGHTNPFGNPSQFAARFIADGKQVARRLRKEHVEEFRKIVGSYMFRTRRGEARLVFPERNVKTYPVKATAEETELERIVSGAIAKFSAVEQTSLLVALMSSPAALAHQVAHMARPGSQAAEIALEVGALAGRVAMPAKAGQLLEIVGILRPQRPDWRMVVFTTRRETQAMLGKVLADAGVSHGFIRGGEPAANRKTIEAFRKKDPEIHVVISTDAGAEGVNRQVANLLVNYDLPWNPMIVEQRIGRVQRIGSQFKSVWVANLVHQDSPEQQIVARLMEKLQVIAHTVGDIEAVLEASEDAGSTSLDQQIRSMIVSAFCGQDQERAAAMRVESIEQARKLLEEQETEMNDMLGAMSDPDQADIPMPKLTPAAPSMPLASFVLAALEREGWAVADDGTGLFTGHDANRERVQLAFDAGVLERHVRPGVFMGQAPQLYQPGKPAFERLVQRWIDRSAVHGADQRLSREETAAIAARWSGEIPGASYIGCEPVAGRATVTGRVHCRARAANAVDSYEKVVAIEITAVAEGAVAPFDAAQVHPKTVFPDVERLVEARAAEDPDIGQFRTFYQQRLERELAKTDAGERREKLVNDLAPGVTAEAAAVEYVVGGEQAVDVAYRVGESAPYRSRITIAGGAVTRQPERQRCDVTGQVLPAECLEVCQVSGVRALRHLMQRSEAGGGYALAEECITCPITGKRILRTEAETCCLTGGVALRSALVQSAVSGRYVVPDRATTCEVTGAAVIDDERVTSDLSGKRFRRDEAVRLADGTTVGHRSEARCCEFSGVYLREADCAVSAYSGKTLAKERLRMSEISGRAGDESELHACGITGTKGLPDELAKSALSGMWLLPDRAVTLEDGRVAAVRETGRCAWTDALLPSSDTGLCALCGLRFDKRLINASGEFVGLRQVLDGTRTGARFADPGFLARTAPAVFQGFTSCSVVSSATKKAHILHGAKSFLGFNRKVFAVIALGEVSGLTLAGKALVGKPTPTGWVATDVHAMP
ncbi:MAG: DEAD/DEAH box helicase, partial [Planctomycetes bacterium]|nr:DEAD/DEAH box helicase [Planctomycetota bacterium]